MGQMVKCVLKVVVVTVVLAGVQQLLVPKYMGRVIEGNLIREYYEETTPHDLLILGDCEVYENISPISLWEQYGITSYIRGSANQLVAQSYYLLEDTLRYETPKAVLFNVAAMQLGEQEKETYNRMTLEGMNWSSAKWNAIRETAMPEEHMVEYIFPLLRYHSRWMELGMDDLHYYFHRDKVSHNGYYMRCDERPSGDFPKERRKVSYKFPEKNQKYLEEISQLCRDRGIRLILMKAPSLYPAWPDQYEEQIEQFAKEKGILYINCLEKLEEIGLDFSRDTYDAGLHLNLYGAEKLATFLGDILQEYAGLQDHRGEEEFAAVWEEKMVFYEQQKEKQEMELQQFGYLRQFQDETVDDG